MDLLGQKQLKSGESRFFTIDYTAWLLENETVSSVVALATPVTVPALIVDAQVSDPKKVTIEVSGGLADTAYVVQVTASTLIDNSPEPNLSQTRIDCFGVDLYGDCVA